MGAERFAVEGRGPGPAMRKRLAGFVVTLRDAGFVIGQAEAQDAARTHRKPDGRAARALARGDANALRFTPDGDWAV